MTPICGDQVVEQIRSFNQDLFIILLTGHKKAWRLPLKPSGIWKSRDITKKATGSTSWNSGGILHQIHQADAHHSKLPKRADQNHRDHAADLQPAWPGRGCRRACAGGKRALDGRSGYLALQWKSLLEQPPAEQTYGLFVRSIGSPPLENLDSLFQQQIGQDIVQTEGNWVIAPIVNEKEITGYLGVQTEAPQYYQRQLLEILRGRRRRRFGMGCCAGC